MAVPAFFIGIVLSLPIAFLVWRFAVWYIAKRRRENYEYFVRLKDYTQRKLDFLDSIDPLNLTDKQRCSFFDIHKPERRCDLWNGHEGHCSYKSE